MLKQTAAKTAFGILLIYVSFVILCVNYVTDKYFWDVRQEKPKADPRGFQQVTSDGSLYAYSAYYDSRDDPQLRVFVISTQVFMKVAYTCKIQMRMGDIRQVRGTFSMLWKYLVPRYVSGVIKCPLTTCCKNSTQLDSVSIYPSVKDLFTPLQNLIIMKHNITILYSKSRMKTITRCYPPIHSNYSKALKFIWNIEISKLSGADKFIFYNYSLSPEVDSVLRHYMNEGIVEVRRWNIPVTGVKTIHYFGQMMAIHDCLMSEMFATKYVLVADLDEIFLPVKGLSLVNMADDVFNYHTDKPKSKFGSVLFQCFAFIVNPNNETKANFTELKEARRLQIEPLLYTTFFRPNIERRKALVIPERVEEMFVHYAVSLKKGFTQKTLGPLKDGVLLHFRDKPHITSIQSTFNYSVFRDLLKYSHPIVQAIANRSKHIFT